QGGGMQHLRAEEGQLRSFIKTERLDAAGLGTNFGIGSHDAVDVSPDLNALGIKDGADDGGGVVVAAAAQGGGNASLRGRDESADSSGDFSGDDSGDNSAVASTWLMWLSSSSNIEAKARMGSDKETSLSSLRAVS